jgi:hypothetical protein
MSLETEIPYRTFAEIESLISAFEACRLPRERWTHRAHLTIALWYLVRHERREATRIIRRNIQRYNHTHGILQTPTGGYHETMTLFFIRVVGAYLSCVSADCSIVSLFNELMIACGDKNLPLRYYSKERLLSREARVRFIEPDLKPLNELLFSSPTVALAPS